MRAANHAIFRLSKCLALLVPALLSGCAGFSDPGPPQIIHPNPSFFATSDYDRLWDVIVDAVDDDFPIAREERPRVIGDVITEARLVARPIVGSTVFEPWRGDSVVAYDRWEATLQSIRRRATVRMVPAPGGFQVQVAVLKELENLRRPALATSSDATFRNDNSIRRFEDPVLDQPIEEGWTPLGNDLRLEQRILSDIHTRFGG